MNTKTMRLPPRRILTSTTSGSLTPNKRKEREDGFDPPKPSTSTPSPKLVKPDIKPRPGSEPPARSNKILAGYLAHEFLTRGTLFGQPWDPVARAAEGPTDKGKAKPSEAEPPKKRAEQLPEKYERYVEVADLLRVDGPHLPGIVNPTQLARFLQL